MGAVPWYDQPLIEGRRFPVPQIAMLAPDRAILTADWCPGPYRDGDAGLNIRAPRGFPYDGSSIPPSAWPVVGHPFGRSLPAGTTHDWGYWTHDPDDRALWDDRFYHDLLLCGYDEAVAYGMWAAVRLEGTEIWAKGAHAISQGWRVSDPLALSHHAEAMLQGPWRMH